MKLMKQQKIGGNGEISQSAARFRDHSFFVFF